MYRSYVNAFSISIRNRFTYIVRCAVVELCLTQRANPNLQGSKPKSCATRSAIRHCTQCWPRKGGTGIPVAGHPTEPYPSRRSGLDYLGSNSCTLFINYLDINNIDKTQNYLKIAFFPFFLFLFVIFTCSQTVPYRYLIVILVKVASCSCAHSFVRGCS